MQNPLTISRRAFGLAELLTPYEGAAFIAGKLIRGGRKMANFKCEGCGATIEARCKPKKCDKCGDGNMIKKEQSCGSQCSK